MEAVDVYGSVIGGGIQRHFNGIWEKWVSEGHTDYRPRNQTVFEVGSGTGETVECLKELDNFVVGSEVSEVGLEDIKKQADAAVFLDAAKDRIPYDDGVFDAVFCLDVLEHISSPYHALTELKRVCIPNGYVHISIPNLQQQGGYGFHKHSVVYPGLFDVHFFRVFLRQMYLRILFEGEWEHPNTYTYVEDTAVPPKHFYFVCENIPTRYDILEVVAGDFDGNMIYDFYSKEERKERKVSVWGEENESWKAHVLAHALNKWPDRHIDFRLVDEWPVDNILDDIDSVDGVVVVSNKRTQEIVDWYIQNHKEIMVVAGNNERD